MTDLDSLFEDDDPPYDAYADPKNKIMLRKKMADAGKGKYAIGDPIEYLKPTNISTLAKVFRMDPKTVEKKLANCPRVGLDIDPTKKFYDFIQAASYLIPHSITPQEFLQHVDKDKLPPALNLNIAKARREWLRYSREAGELWSTEEVFEVLGKVMIMMKERLRLWPIDLAEKHNMDDKQLQHVQELVRELQTDLYKELVDLPQKRQTFNKLLGEDSIGEIES